MDTYIIAIITGSVALISVYLTNRNNLKSSSLQIEYNKSEQKRKLTIDKLEELYELQDEWLKNLFLKYNNLILVMEEKITYDQYLDLIIDQKVSQKFARLEMLLYMYFNELIPFYTKITDLRELGNDISHTYKLEYKKGNINGETFIPQLLNVQKEIIIYGDIFKKEISKKAITI